MPLATPDLGVWRHQRTVRRIAALKADLAGRSDRELHDKSLELKFRAKSQAKPKSLVVEAFALVREAARRTLAMRHFDVQLLGGLTLVERGLAEMQTGEGKTLTATLPTYLYALYGRGAHVATVNDYLARRDAELMQPVYEALGLSVGVVESSTSPPRRKAAYSADVTYGTAKEFGFDFLRDRILLRKRERTDGELIRRLSGAAAASGDGDQILQRPPFFMLVDEADSVLIDDAGTPLIIAGAAGRVAPETARRYRFAASVVERFTEDEHFTVDRAKQRIGLTFDGRDRLRTLPPPAELSSTPLVTLYEDVERALAIERFYARDRNYVVRPTDDERESAIAIVDEFTGRIAEGRKWRAGIHQAVEAKEQVSITDDGGQAARITVQDFFLRYRHLSGMSGTAQGSAGELRRIYKLRTRSIPTNRPPIRRKLSTQVFAREHEKWQAVVAEILAIHQVGRPVLVGTRSIDKSERLSAWLTEADVEHEVLNARHESREAEIVARAGELGKVTVATNMAGRGTDIRLTDEVRALGGLHVVMTEMHEAARIDRQLVGRCGRQGDPGTYRVFLSLEDELLSEGFGAESSTRRTVKPSGKLNPRGTERLFRRAQRAVERRKFRHRKRLLAHEARRRSAALPAGLDPFLDLRG